MSLKYTELCPINEADLKRHLNIVGDIACLYGKQAQYLANLTEEEWE